MAAVSVPHAVPLHEPLRFLDADTWRSLRTLLASRFGFRFFVNGVLTDPALPLPHDADVVSIFPPAPPDTAPDVADMATAIWDEPAPTSTTTTFMPPGQPASSSNAAASGSGMQTAPFLSMADDGIVPASQWWQLRDQARRHVEERVQLARIAGLANSPYTLFDEVAGARILQRLPHWSLRQCIFHAISTAHVPDPVGRLLEVPVPGWPEPQVLVSTERLLRTHRAFVHLIGGEETAPLVTQAPQGASMRRVHVLIGRFAPVTCWVHDQVFECTFPLPADTDFVRVIEADSEVFDARIAGLDTPEALPREHFLQPAYGTHFRARGYVRHHGFPTGIAGRSFHVPQPPVSPTPSTSSASDVADGSSSCSGGLEEQLMDFTVFDTLHHARILQAELPASRLTLLKVIREATPDLSGPLGHRVLRDPLRDSLFLNLSSGLNRLLVNVLCLSCIQPLRGLFVRSPCRSAAPCISSRGLLNKHAPLHVNAA